MLYMKDNSHVICKFGLSNSTKIQEHMRVAARECQLRNELYRNIKIHPTILAHDVPFILATLPVDRQVISSLSLLNRVNVETK